VSSSVPVLVQFHSPTISSAALPADKQVAGSTSVVSSNAIRAQMELAPPEASSADSVATSVRQRIILSLAALWLLGVILLSLRVLKESLHLRRAVTLVRLA